MGKLEKTRESVQTIYELNEGNISTMRALLRARNVPDRTIDIVISGYIDMNESHYKLENRIIETLELADETIKIQKEAIDALSR